MGKKIRTTEVLCSFRHVIRDGHKLLVWKFVLGCFSSKQVFGASSPASSSRHPLGGSAPNSLPCLEEVRLGGAKHLLRWKTNCHEPSNRQFVPLSRCLSNTCPCFTFELSKECWMHLVYKVSVLIEQHCQAWKKFTNPRCTRYFSFCHWGNSKKSQLLP